MKQPERCWVLFLAHQTLRLWHRNSGRVPTQRVSFGFTYKLCPIFLSEPFTFLELMFDLPHFTPIVSYRVVVQQGDDCCPISSLNHWPI